MIRWLFLIASPNIFSLNNMEVIPQAVQYGIVGLCGMLIVLVYVVVKLSTSSRAESDKVLLSAIDALTKSAESVNKVAGLVTTILESRRRK